MGIYSNFIHTVWMTLAKKNMKQEVLHQLKLICHRREEIRTKGCPKRF